MIIVLIFVVLLLAIHGMALFGALGWMGVLLQLKATIGEAGGSYIWADIFDALTNNFITPFGQLTGNDLLLPIPLFTLAGYLLAKSEAPNRIVIIFRFLTQKFLGKTAYTLGVMALIVSAVFTPLTGASGVTIIALGGILYPILNKQGYPDKLNLGIITSSGSLGLLFFPSLPVIIYGIISNNAVSIRDLFLWGLLPGALLIILPSIYVVWATKNIEHKIEEELKWSEIEGDLTKFILEAAIVPIIFFLFLSGKIVVSEMGLLTLVYFYILEVVVYREISWNKQIMVFEEALSLLGGILIIIFFAISLTSYMIDQQIPQHLFEWVQGYITSKWSFLIILNMFLLVVGALMDIFSAIVVVAPLIIPVGQMFGINMVHLGLLFLTNLEIGYLTPPVGINLFISSFRFKKDMVDIYRSIVPFLLILLLAQIIITYVPLIWLGGQTPGNIAQEQVKGIQAGNFEELYKNLALGEMNLLDESCINYKELDKKVSVIDKIKNKIKKTAKMRELSDEITPEYTWLKENNKVAACSPKLMTEAMVNVRAKDGAILAEMDDIKVKNVSINQSSARVTFNNEKIWKFIQEEGHWRIDNLKPAE